MATRAKSISTRAEPWMAFIGTAVHKRSTIAVGEIGKTMFNSWLFCDVCCDETGGGFVGFLTADLVFSSAWCVLHCTVLYCTVLYCSVLYCTVLYWSAYHHPPSAPLRITPPPHLPLPSSSHQAPSTTTTPHYATTLQHYSTTTKLPPNYKKCSSPNPTPMSRPKRAAL